MKLSEAKRRFIGKKFRIKHAERGSDTYRPCYIENVIGVCTNIEARTLLVPGTDKTMTYFRFRIESEDTNWKWFSTREIEPVEK